MKMLVIAAGRGSGFNGKAPRSHKTLSPVHGLAVIERILAACPDAEELIVVTGYQAKRLEEKLNRLLQGKIALTFVHNPEWERANGVSVLAAKEVLKNEKSFLLTMSDHVFEPSLVEKLTAIPPGPGECLLAVDRKLENVFDLDDATKVKLSDGDRIVKIGKQLEEFDAADTGVFFCTPAIFDALESSITQGGESLSHGIQILCKKGKMGFRDVSGCMWQDVDNPESLHQARKRVWQTVQKPRDGIVSRLLNRKVSGFITRRICALPIHPNYVTIFNLLLSAAAGWLMSTGHLLTGAILAQLYSIIDGVDGELARLKFQGSWFGSWLDKITDRLCDWMIICGACWSITSTTGNEWLAWSVMFLAILSNVCYRTAVDSLLISGVLRKSDSSFGLIHRIEKWFYEREMVFGITHDSYLLILALGVAFGESLAVICLLIILETLWWVVKAFQARQTKPSDTYIEFLETINTDVKNEKQTRIPELAVR